MIENVTTNEKKRPGRKPMTPEEKAAASAARAAEKAKAVNLWPELFIQYQGDEIALDTLAEAAKADFHASKKRTLAYVGGSRSHIYFSVTVIFRLRLRLCDGLSI